MQIKTSSFAITDEIINEELQEEHIPQERMFLENIKLVYSRVLQRFYKFPVEFEDLISYGMIGLTKAVNSYDSTKNIKFCSYAVSCIDNEIISFLRSSRRIIKPTEIKRENLIKPIAPIENIEDEQANIYETFEQKEELEALRYCIASLPLKHQKVISLYYGLADNRCYNQREIAELLNITTSAVQGILSRTIEVLRANMYSLDKKGIMQRKIRDNHFYPKK